ncbi:MAG: tetratricopeptide repeat protein [Labilithrix sp.]|nr:tetratricopeptide repeat protein [Labilithrix sp.]MCW5815853.1 tetratricopeptide repeat protein [Labilithrix sp.]
MEQKRFAEACPKLKESQRLDPGGGTLLNLASCHASEGKIASALDEYREALAMALRDNRKDREQIARTNIGALEKDVPRVTVLVPHPVTGIEVKLDTTTLPSAAWGVATAVDPGAHVVTASAPDHATATVHADVRTGERKVIEVPALSPSLAREKSPGAAPDAPRAAADPRAATRPNPVFWAALGVGLGGLVLSAVTGALTLTNALDAGDGCIEERSYCHGFEARDSLSNARTFGWVSTISFGVGTVGLIVALVVPSKKSVVVGDRGVGVRF